MAAPERLVRILQHTICSLVAADHKDLTSRQMGVFLHCYLDDGEQTVRGLAAYLNISKPAITRALDRLELLDLARRKQDHRDRRSIIVARTLQGSKYLRQVRLTLMSGPLH